MTADEALAHPYLSSYVRVSSFFNYRRALNPRLKHDPDDEPAATTLDPDYFNFEGMQCKLRPIALFSSSHHRARQKKMNLLIRPNSRDFSMMKSFLLSRLFKHLRSVLQYLLL